LAQLALAIGRLTVYTLPVCIWTQMLAMQGEPAW
jgi:hypothetical protein